MQGLRNPVGDLPPETYWKRRVGVLAGLVLLIIIIYFLITSPKSGGDNTDPGSSPSPSVSISTSGGPVVSARACTADDVAVSAAPTNQANAVGQPVAFTISLSLAGQTPCLFDTAEGDFALNINSGSDEVWLNSHCPAAEVYEAKKLVLQADASETLTATWPGTRSAEGCSTNDASPPQAGTYRAYFTVSGAKVDDVRFQYGN